MIRSMGQSHFILFGSLLIAMIVIVPSSIFAANINCNQLTNPCNGTDSPDTMTASGIDGNINYNINGFSRGDKIVVKNVDTTFTLQSREVRERIGLQAFQIGIRCCR